jgi:hypothetical protein
MEQHVQLTSFLCFKGGEVLAMNKLFLMSRDTSVVNYWTPSQIPTALWLDASDSTTIAQSEGKVSKWDDKSSNGRNAIQEDGVKQPYTGTRTIGGLNVLDFNGIAQNFRLPTFPNPTTSGLIMIVADLDETEAIDIRIYCGQSGSNSRFLISKNYDNMRFILSSTAASIDKTYPYGQRIICGYRDVDNLGIGYDGVYNEGERIATAPTLTSTYIGSYNGSANFYKGSIGEIVGLDYYSLAIRQKLEGYAYHKWGQTTNLAADHPYKNTPPIV